MLLPDSLLALIQQGEGLNVEFKRSAAEITSDVYDTVCSFSNREGGRIFLGVKDNGDIIGVQKDCVDQMNVMFGMAKKGVLERKGSKRYGHWVLKS